MLDRDIKILIVDDMMTMRKLIRKSLMKNDFSKFVEACDGQEAWEKLNSDSEIDLIISDWNMPNLTGLEFLQRVRGSDSLSSTPFMLLTAESDKAQVVEAIQNGVSSYVVKPFSEKSLMDAIEAAYNKKVTKKAA